MLPENDEWKEGYLKNVWCKYRSFISSEGDLYIVAKSDLTVRVFKLNREIIKENKNKELNEVMEKAEEVSEIPKFIQKVIEKN